MQNPTKWPEEDRKIAWIVISFARRELKLTISPCVAYAFVLLHRYFNDPCHKDEPLYLLLTSALFLSCKIEDTFRTMNFIFSAISKCIIKISEKITLEHAKEVFGDRDFTIPELTSSEMKQIALCEIHLLNSINWDMDIDLPFYHFDKAKPAFESLSQNKDLDGRFNAVLRDLCLIMRNEQYLNIPPPVSAAVSIQHCFSEIPLPESTSGWIEQLKNEYPNEFEIAFQIIKSEGPKCVPITK